MCSSLHNYLEFEILHLEQLPNQVRRQEVPRPPWHARWTRIYAYGWCWRGRSTPWSGTLAPASPASGWDRPSSACSQPSTTRPPYRSPTYGAASCWRAAAPRTSWTSWCGGGSCGGRAGPQRESTPLKSTHVPPSYAP